MVSNGLMPQYPQMLYIVLLLANTHNLESCGCESTKKVRSGRRTRLGFLPIGAHDAFVGSYRDRGCNDPVERIPTLAFHPFPFLAVLNARPDAGATEGPISRP
jgi:hypothetical protein